MKETVTVSTWNGDNGLVKDADGQTYLLRGEAVKSSGLELGRMRVGAMLQIEVAEYFAGKKEVKRILQCV